MKQLLKIALLLISFQLIPSLGRAADRYWVNGSGNWSESAHWSTISGGSGGASVPTINDNVYFSKKSFPTSIGIVTIDQPAFSKTLFWGYTGKDYTLQGTAPLTINGSLLIDDNIQNNYSGVIYLSSSENNNSIFSRISFLSDISITGSGIYTLQTNLTTSGKINIAHNNLVTNGFTVSGTSTKQSIKKSATLKSSTIPALVGSGTLTVTSTSTPVTCYGLSDGSASVIVTGGVEPYTYSWVSQDRGAMSLETGPSITGVPAGIYMVSIFDANRKPGVATIEVKTPFDIYYQYVDHTDPKCNNGNDGDISIFATGGTTPLTFSIDGGTSYQGLPNEELVKDFTDLSSGSYHITIKDASGCSKSYSGNPVVLTNPAAIVISKVDVTSTPKCHGGTDGAMNVTASGGTGTLSYSVDNGTNWQSGSGNITGLTAGSYNVQVKDANSCTSTWSSNPVTITEPAAINVSAATTPVTCNGGTDGSITITATGGTGTLTYSIDGGATYNNNNVFSALKAGSYPISVKDANGCTATATVNVTEPAVLIASITPKDQQICSGSGAISMDGNPGGGNGGYTHLWTGSGAALLSSTTIENPTFDDKTPGAYTLTYKVTDSKGCTVSDNTSVTVNAAISITAQPSPQTVCAGSNVSFSVAATGGGTLSYQWQKDGTNLTDGGSISNSKTATLAVSNVSSADAGKYTCLVSTTTSCPSVTSSQAQLTVNPATAITTQPVSQTVCVGSTVNFNVTATGTAPITYQWQKGGSDVTDGGNISGSKTSALTITNADNTNAGDYTCIVHSSCGSDVTTNKATLGFNPVTTINSQPASQTVCAGSTVSFSVTATGAGTLTYQWQKGGSNISGATGSTLTLTNVTSSDGGSYVCIVNSVTCPKAVNSAAAILTVNSLPTVSFSGVTSPYCQSASPVTLTGSPLGGTFSGSAVTDIGGGTASFFPTSAGTYTITYTYTDANTCSNSSKKDIVVNALPTVTFTGTLASQCDGSTVYQLTGGSPAGGSYSGPGVSGTNFNATAAGVGTHTITYSYTDAKGCSASATNSITVNAKTVITTQPLDQTVCSGSTVGFTVTATGSGTLTYQWKKDGINLTDGSNISGSTTSTLTDSNVGTSDAGNYTCTVTGTCSSATSNPAKLSVNAATVINTQPVSQTICSGSNVSFSVAATGTTPLTYQWQKDGANLSDGGNISGSSTSALQINNADNTHAGAYRCIVHSACGTDVTSNAANLAFYSLTTITQQPSDVISCSGNTVSFLISATAEGSPTYQWYKGATKLTDGGNIIGSTSSNLNITNISKSDEGSYYCAVASGVCPSPLNSSNAKLTVNIIPTVSFSGVTSPYCQSLSAATLTGNHTGGSFTGTDVSDNGDGTASFFPTSAGTYTINYFYTDGDGCSNSAQQNILVNAFPTVAFDGTLAIQCAGATSYPLTGGSPEGGIYAGSGVTGTNFDAVTAGPGRHTLTYTYTDANGCSASATNGIEVSTAIQATVDPSSILALGCNGISDGAINVTVTGGNEPYTFSWTGPDGFTQSTQNITNLKAGTYNLSVTDANGCVQDFPAIATVDQPVLLKETVAQTRITCYSAADGKILIHASGGTSPYTFSIYGDDESSYTTDSLFTELGPDTYYVIVKDNNGCKTSIDTVSISDGVQITTGFNVPAISGCYGDPGTIYLSGKGGTSPLLFSVSTTEGTPGAFQADSMFTSLKGGINYYGFVKDGSGCMVGVNDGKPLVINQPTEIHFKSYTITDVTGCSYNTNGKIKLTVTGGTTTPNPPLAYDYYLDGTKITNAGGSYTFSNVGGGNHVVRIIDRKACVKDTIFSVGSPAPIAVDSTIHTSKLPCNGSANGQIKVYAHGGTGALTYSIDGTNFQTDNTFTGLSAKTYQVTVKDSKACIYSDTTKIVIAEPVAFSVDTVYAGKQISCFGHDGQINALAAGGTAPYTYTLNPGQPSSVTNQTGIFANLDAAKYVVSMTDANGCGPVISDTVVLKAPVPLTVVSAKLADQSCSNHVYGIVPVVAQGGTRPYQYSLDNSTYQVDSALVITASGKYGIFVKDVNGCMAQGDSVTMGLPPAPLFMDSVIVQNVLTCAGSPEGSIRVVAHGGRGNLRYAVNHGTFQAGSIFNSLTGGDYTISIKDSTCEVDSLVKVQQPLAITVDSVSVKNVACNGADNGSIFLKASGGYGKLTYTLMPGSIANTTGMFANLKPGTYTINITDTTVCPGISSGPYTITESPAVRMVSRDTSYTGCSGKPTGSITIHAAGGIKPYEYSIDGGLSFQADSLFTKIPAGTYVLAIRDTSICSPLLVDTVTFADPVSWKINSVTSTDILCYGARNGSIQVNVSPLDRIYTYTLYGKKDTLINTTMPVSSLGADTFRVVVNDSTGCSLGWPTPVVIHQPAAWNVKYVSVAATCDNPGGITINVVAGGTSPYKYALDADVPAGYQDSNTFAAKAGNHNFYVKDAVGCTFSSTATVQDSCALTALSVDVDLSGCPGTMKLTAKNGTAPYWYAVNTSGDTTATALTKFTGDTTVWNLSNGSTYKVFVKDANGRMFFGSYAITGWTYKLFLSQPSQCSNNFGSASLSIKDTTQYGFYFDDATVPGVSSITGLDPGIHSIKVVDKTTGCHDTQPFTIVSACATTGLNVTVTPTNPACSGSPTGKISLAPVNGTAPYQYSISGDTTKLFSSSKDTTFDKLPDGLYPIYVIDSKGSYFKDTVTLTNSITLAVLDTVINSSCMSAKDGAINISVSGGQSPYTYTWSTGATTQNLQNVPAGTYTVTVADANGCTSTIQRDISGVNSLLVDAGRDTTICFGDTTFRLKAVPLVEGATYSWTPADSVASPSSNVTAIKTHSKQTFHITVSDTKCSFTDSVTVDFHPYETINYVPIQKVKNDTVTLTFANKPDDYLRYKYSWAWSDTLTDGTSALDTTLVYAPIAKPDKNTVFYVTMIDTNGCVHSDQILVKVNKLFVPNAFTPNGDGIHDTWHIPFADKVDGIEVLVFNRWGEQVFHSSGYGADQEWNGTYKNHGDKLPVGTYYFVIKIPGDSPVTGSVTLIR